MQEFTTNKIIHGFDEIASILKEARIAQKKELDHVAKELGIKRKYLEAIENGDFSKLPSGLYGKSYIKEYAILLEVRQKPLLDLYDESIIIDEEKEKKLFVRKVPSFHYFLSIPKIFRALIIVAIVVICISYLSYYVKNIIKPPTLDLYDISENMVIERNYLELRGKTENESEVMINEESILLDNNSEFYKKINLKKGINTIIVTSKKKYSQKNEQIIKVLVK